MVTLIPVLCNLVLKEGSLPAKLFGGSLMIEEKDLKLVADRKPGRPNKQVTERSS
jgi:chemotaxis receptor (MCP) glutamine deamidase CheD